MTVDLAMTVILLLLMGYSRIGETAHEVLPLLMRVMNHGDGVRGSLLWRKRRWLTKQDIKYLDPKEQKE